MDLYALKPPKLKSCIWAMGIFFTNHLTPRPLAHGPFKTRLTTAFSLSISFILLSSTFLSVLHTPSDHYGHKPAPTPPTLGVHRVQAAHAPHYTYWPSQRTGPPDPLRESTTNPQGAIQGSYSTISVCEPSIPHPSPYRFSQPFQCRVDAIQYHGHAFTGPLGACTIHPTLIPTTSPNTSPPNSNPPRWRPLRSTQARP